MLKIVWRNELVTGLLESWVCFVLSGCLIIVGMGVCIFCFCCYWFSAAEGHMGCVFVSLFSWLGYVDVFRTRIWPGFSSLHCVVGLM